MTNAKVHLLSESEEMQLDEARKDLYELITQGQAISARERARKVTENQSGELDARRLRQAQAMAERFEWRPEAAVVLFGAQVCENCGTVHSRFEGYGVLFRRRSDRVERIAAAGCLDKGLPMVRRELLSKSPACIDCIEQVVHAPLPPPAYHNRRRADAEA